MDDLGIARARRAFDLLGDALADAPVPVHDDRRAKAQAFVDAGLALIQSAPGEGVSALQRHPNPLVQRAGAHGFGAAIWASNDGVALAENYIASVAEHSLLDLIAKHARLIPSGSTRVLVAADAVGDVVAEGDPKPVRKLNLSLADAEPTKSVATVVLSQELLAVGGDAVRRLFETELASAVTRCANMAVLDVLTDSSATFVSGTGDPLQNLRTALQAAPASDSFVVAMPSGQVADLATRVENRGGMSVRGGTFAPGIEVVAIADLNDMVCVPASRCALWLGGVEMRSAEHATVDLRDTPTDPATPTSLWQTGSVGLLIERQWRIAQVDGVVIVEGASP